MAYGKRKVVTAHAFDPEIFHVAQAALEQVEGRWWQEQIYQNVLATADLDSHSRRTLLSYSQNS
jgi:hypothetical protein